MDLTPNIHTLESSATYGKFVIEPLERGYGVTLGNSLRRVLLSSIPGAAITYVKIDKVLQEFSTIPGVKEDTTEFLLNLKGLSIKVHRNGSGWKHEPKTLRIQVKGSKEGSRVTGADVQCPEDMEIVNPEVYLATVASDDSILAVEMTIETNKGYVLPDKQERRREMGIGVIPMGAAFTPVHRVNYIVEPTRVQANTNVERLILEVTTSGAVTPESAISEAARILIQNFSLFATFQPGAEILIGEVADRITGEVDTNLPVIRIEELDFSVRTYNCLKKANILTIAELVNYTQGDLMQIRNFGKKSLTEVQEKLRALNLTLKGGSLDDVFEDDSDGESDED